MKLRQLSKKGDPAGLSRDDAGVSQRTSSGMRLSFYFNTEGMRLSRLAL